LEKTQLKHQEATVRATGFNSYNMVSPL
jgi:hypothetical protein